MENETTQKKPKAKAARKPKAPKPAKSVEELVLHALTVAANDPKAKWTGASDKALFNTKEANHEAAIKSCLDANRPLLKQMGANGALTSTGFELVAETMPPEQVGTLATIVLAGLPLEERETFISRTISRTPQASAELTLLLAEIIASAKAVAEAKVAEAAKKKQAHDAAIEALAKAQRLLAESLANQKDTLRRQYEALGGDPTELREPEPKPKPEPEPKGKLTEPITAEDADFRRDVAAQLASSWRATWEMNKPDAREFLESAMWNISGFKLIGEVGQRVAYSGRVHESVAGVFSGDQVKITRPGWVLEEDAGEFVILKAVVEK